ncbi:MAG: DNA gyrase subunit A, partial [Clostridia bacterium]|nr:DNA gyrase subunit A [Clostridia bacterium]
GMSVLREGANILTITETGFGRLSVPEDYRLQSRAGKGIKNYRTNLYGDVAAIKVVNEDDDIIIISSNGIIIRVSVGEIRLCARPAKGVRVMRTDETNKIVAVARVPHEEGEETAAVEDDGSADEGAAETAEEIAEDNAPSQPAED